MAVSKANQRAVNKYVKANYDRINVTMPKGEKEVIQGCAAAQGESVNGFIVRAVRERMERDGGGTVVGTPAKAAAGPQEAAPTVGGSLPLPADVLEDIQRIAETEGENVTDFVSKAVSAYAIRDDVAAAQEAAEGPQGSGGVSLPPDVLEAVQQAANAAGEAVPDYVARVIREAVEHGKGGNASVSPAQAQEGPCGAGVVSLPLETEKAAQQAAEATGETTADFIARAVDTQVQRDKISLHMGVNPATGQKVQNVE